MRQQWSYVCLALTPLTYNDYTLGDTQTSMNTLYNMYKQCIVFHIFIKTLIVFKDTI